MNKNYLIVISIAIVVILVGVYLWMPDKGTETPTSTSTPTPATTPTSQTNEPVSHKNLPICSIGGQIRYVEPNTYINEDNFLTYSNVQDPAQLINWTITPDDGVSVGPNIFSLIPRPDGKERISATFDNTPIHKEYTITAEVTYFEVINGSEKKFETDCSGTTVIKIDY